MTPDAAVDLIANRLGKRGTALDTEIIAELQAAQIELEEMPELPWFLLTLKTDLTMTATTQTTSLPSDFLMEDDYGGLFGTDTGDSNKKKRIPKKDFSILQTNQANYFGTANFPECYAIQNATIYWYPTPDLAYVAELWYYRKDPTTIAAAGAANLWLTNAPSVLYNLAGYNIASYLRFMEVAAKFESDYQKSLARLMATNEARRQAALDAYVGG